MEIKNTSCKASDQVFQSPRSHGSVPAAASFFQWSLIGFLSFLLFSAAAEAQTSAKIQGFLINADSLYRDNETESVVLEGNVQIVHEDQHISCEKARVDLRSRRLDLWEKVRIVTPKNTMGGDQISLDYESNTGLLINGFVQSGLVIFEGETIQKTGENDFYVVKANYTTCNNCPSTWSFSGTQIRAELGGYAYIKNSVLRVGVVPIFWLPYLIVPLKSDRQSGLLTPELEISEAGGVAIGQPVFLVLSRSQDATYTVKNYQFRGPKSLLNYRYVLSENSGGEFDGAWIRDRAFKDSPRVDRFRDPEKKGTAINRWFVKYDHSIELPDGTAHHLQLNNASDLQYPKDFPKETRNHVDPAMESRMSFTKNTEDFHWSLDSSYYINLLQSNPLAGNDSAVHRLPELKLVQKPKEIRDTGLVYAFDIDLVNFARSGPAYDDLSVNPTTGLRWQTNGTGWQANDPADSPLYDRERSDVHLIYDGAFNPEKDLIRTGQRLDIKPSLSYPMKLGNYVDLVPKVTLRDTHYQFPIEGYSQSLRRYLRTELAARTTLSRIYGDLDNPTSTRYKHEILPELTYTTAPWIEHESHPFWGPGNQAEAPFGSNSNINDTDLAGLNGLQFDYNDRLYDRNLVTLSINNRLSEKYWLAGSPLYRQIANLKISQSYDAYQDSRKDPNKEPWSRISTLLDVRFNHFETNTALDYYPYQKVTSTSSRIKLFNDKGQFFQIGISKQYPVTPGRDVNSANRTEDYTFRTGINSKYVNLMGQFVYDANWINRTNNNRIKSWAYITQLKPPGDCWLITLIHNQVTGGLGTNLNVYFEFTFDGVPKPPLPAETLDEYFY